MEEGETVSILSRKELRKQRLMEYLAKKGRLKLPDPKAYLRDDFDVKKPVPSALKVVKGKENKVPADTLGYKGTKVRCLAAQATRHPDRKAFTVTNKIQGSMMTGQKKPSSLCGNNGSTQLELKPSPVLTGMCSVVSSKSKLNTTSLFKKQSNRRNQASDRALSNGPSNSRFISSSNASQSGPMKTVSVRMSLGPLIKTKTGLIPAVIQPRNTKSHLTHTSATGAQATSTTTSVASKVRSSTSASVFQMSAMAQRKTRPTTVLNNPVNERPVVSSTTRARIKVQDQNKSGSKPLLGNHSQPSCKNQISSRLKSLPASKCTGAPIKQMGTNKSTHVPTDRSTQKKSEVGGEKNGKPVSRCNFRVVSGVAQAAVAGLGGKTKSSKDTQSKKGHSSANAPLPQTGLKRAGAPVLSQTVLQAARAISQPSGQATKTPKGQVNIIPQTEGKKVTAAQEERTRKLQEWREAKGISYKRPPMTVKPQVRHTVAVPQPFWTTMKEEDEAHSLICAVDRSLADCIKLLAEGCPRDQVKEVLSRLPAVSQKFAKYWICQARLMEQEGNLDVLPMFEEAVRVVLEPVDELRNVVFEILKKKDEFQASEANEEKDEQIATVKSSPESNNNSVMTPKPVRALICGEKGDSSVVKYKITKTPGGPRSQQGEPAQVNGQEVRFFTPVRRSVRIKRASLRYPASLQDHDLCVASYSDLISEEDKEKSEEQEGGETSPSVNDTPMYIYRQNEALKDKVFVQLVCD